MTDDRITLDQIEERNRAWKDFMRPVWQDLERIGRGHKRDLSKMVEQIDPKTGSLITTWTEPDLTTLTEAERAEWEAECAELDEAADRICRREFEWWLRVWAIEQAPDNPALTDALCNLASAFFTLGEVCERERGSGTEAVRLMRSLADYVGMPRGRPKEDYIDEAIRLYDGAPDRRKSEAIEPIATQRGITVNSLIRMMKKRKAERPPR